MKLNIITVGETQLTDLQIATMFCALVKLRGDLDAEPNKEKEVMTYKGESINTAKLIAQINEVTSIIETV